MRMMQGSECWKKLLGKATHFNEQKYHSYYIFKLSLRKSGVSFGSKNRWKINVIFGGNYPPCLCFQKKKITNQIF
jgi:hypothetical protein